MHCNKVTKPDKFSDTRGNATQTSGKLKYFQIILSTEGLIFSFFSHTGQTQITGRRKTLINKYCGNITKLSF